MEKDEEDKAMRIQDRNKMNSKIEELSKQQNRIKKDIDSTNKNNNRIKLLCGSVKLFEILENDEKEINNK